MRKPFSIALLAGAVTIIPAGAALATTHAGATAASATATPTKTAAKKTTTTAHTYVGPSEDMRWGPVQVTIVVKGTMVTNLSATAPTERTRSAFINNQAIPMLRQEVLQAKTATKIKT